MYTPFTAGKVLRFPVLALCGVTASLPVLAADKTSLLDTIVVTETRQKTTIADTGASIGVISEHELRELNPTHSSEALNRIAGVNIVQLSSSGEGTAAAIRQPVSYGPVYLYLENGVPTRSSGFFNHNALYETNVSIGNGVEVMKGPGSALYGSDAIGAVINLLSGQPPKEDALGITLETGEFGWRRGQLRGARLTDSNGFTVNLEASEVDGWREHNESERQSLTASWNTDFDSGWRVNTVATGTHLDYNTGGTGLLYDDYKSNPTQAGNLIGYREVTAFRASSAFEKELTNGNVLSITPFARSNDLEYLAHWTLNSGRVQPPPPWCPTCPPALDSQDAHINESGHDSVGVLIKHSIELNENNSIIIGADFDYTKGDVRQTYIERTDSDPGVYWLSYQKNGLLYDYDVSFRSVSPYIHAESQLTEKLKITGGLRYDNARYEYDNNLSVDLTDPLHKRLPSQAVGLSHLSPKLSLIYQFSPTLNGYTSYRHAFRIPTSDQLFRSGQNEDSSALEPVKADSLEFGLRGNLTDRIAFDSAVYYMVKRDDILSISDPVTGGRRNANAGKTEHYGLELGGDIVLSDTLDLFVAYTTAEHKYKEWVDRSGDYTGNDIPDAPEAFANVRLSYHPGWLNGGRFEIEWAHQGEHWIDEQNANDGNPGDRDKYDGHDLLNVRADIWATDQLNLYVRVLNVTDEQYAETTSKWGPKFVPGRPRTAFVGLRYDFGRNR